MYMWHLQTYDHHSNPIAVHGRFHGFSYLTGKCHKPHIGGFVQIQKLVHFLFGNAKGVALGIWMDVQKSKIMVVLRNFITRDLPFDNLCKYTGHFIPISLDSLMAPTYHISLVP